MMFRYLLSLKFPIIVIFLGLVKACPMGERAGPYRLAFHHPPKLFNLGVCLHEFRKFSLPFDVFAFKFCTASGSR